MSKDRVVQILCRRDNISEEEATELVESTVHLMDLANWDPETCEDIMREELGLEPDYIFDLI